MSSGFSYHQNSLIAKILDNIDSSCALFKSYKIHVVIEIVDLYNSCKFIFTDHDTFITAATRQKVCFDFFGGLAVCFINASILFESIFCSTQNYDFTLIDGNN